MPSPFPGRATVLSMPRVVALGAAAVAVNIALGQAVAFARLPLYLDSIGTVVVALLAGPWAAALTGALSNVIWGAFVDPVTIPFALTAAVVGVVSGFAARRGAFDGVGTSLGTGLFLGVVAAAVSTPIVAYLFGGVTGSGSTLLIAVLRRSGQDLLSAVFQGSLLADVADKVLTVLVAREVARRVGRGRAG